MVGLVGAQIWVRNKVDFSQSLNLIPAGRRRHRSASAA
ncbi:hypothetical protein SALBM135S_00780 [Streptomyces alboniger]